MSHTLNITYGAHKIGSDIDGVPSYGQQKITVGKYCSIAANVTVFTEPSHNTTFISTYPFHHPGSAIRTDTAKLLTIDKPFVHRGELNIGNDVWIGWGVRLFTGLTIGDGAIVGAYSLVTKDVPPYCIAVGQPLQIIRKRFSDEDIEFLLKLKWWDFPDSVIAEIPHILQSPYIDKLKDWAIQTGRYVE